jgi:phosphatidylserine/phosphatidylglycerophosphate/cardiolipin synthase-like enzyme
MGVQLKVIQDGDDALLVWSVPAVIPGCLGFAIQRQLTRDGAQHEEWIENYAGFVGQQHADGERRPSTQWPFQGFTWTDHGIDQGDSARYRVVPVLGSEDAPAPDESGASDWEPSEAAAAAPAPASPYRAFFNRGFVMSQFMARYLHETGKTLEQFKQTISAEDDRTIRRFLSGDLRVAMLDLLDGVPADGEVYAALFECSDAELLDRLVALGARAHLVLANGSIQKQKDETSAQARTRDENAAGRARLLAAGVDVAEHDRFISPGALGHNKFLVVTDAQRAAQRAWTGSTNWTPTGLCTQLNNGLQVDDPQVAGLYLDQWHRLRDAGSAFPPELVNANSQPKQNGAATVWFTRTHGEGDLTALREVVADAKDAILFLMFMPGATGVLADIQARDGQPGLFVRGVVSTLPNGPHDASKVDVTLTGHDDPGPHRLDIIQPEGRDHAFAYWAAEVKRKEFLSSIGYAIIHSKVLVTDPFSESPTVVTGSHNFSTSASTENDENFVIVRGDDARALAAAYTVNIMGAWRHYRARVNRGTQWEGLKPDDSWMAGSLAARQRDAGFWGF